MAMKVHTKALAVATSCRHTHSPSLTYSIKVQEYLMPTCWDIYVAARSGQGMLCDNCVGHMSVHAKGQLCVLGWMCF